MLLARGCWQSWLPRQEKQVRRGCWRLRGQLTSGGHLNSCLTNLGSYICWTNFLAKHFDSLFCSHINAVAQTESSRTKLWRVFMKKQKRKVSVLQKKSDCNISVPTNWTCLIYISELKIWLKFFIWEHTGRTFHWCEWLDKWQNYYSWTDTFCCNAEGRSL